MLSILEAIGIISLAITGAAEGVRARLDLFGVVVTATIMTLGGGIARDILLGAHPPSGLLTLWYLIACAVTAVLVFLCYPWLAKLKTVIQFATPSPWACSPSRARPRRSSTEPPPARRQRWAWPTVWRVARWSTCSCGGLPRCCAKRSTPFPSLGGGFLLAFGYSTGIPRTEVTLGVVALIVAVRMPALKLNWHLPVGRHERQANPLSPEESLLGFQSANWPTIELPAVKPSSPKLIRRGCSGKAAFCRGHRLRAEPGPHSPHAERSRLR